MTKKDIEKVENPDKVFHDKLLGKRNKVLFPTKVLFFGGASLRYNRFVAQQALKYNLCIQIKYFKDEQDFGKGQIAQVKLLA